MISGLGNIRLTEFASDEFISDSFGFLSFVLPLTRPMLEVSKATLYYFMYTIDGDEGVINFE